MTTVTPASFDVDLYSDPALLDPYPIYQRLRDSGPVVYLEATDAWAITRYAGVREAMRDWDTFTSEEGVALNDPMNASTQGSVLCSDPPEHDKRRAVMMERLNLREMRGLRSQVDARIARIVDRLVNRGKFDAVTDLARAVLAEVSGSLIGLSEEMIERALNVADAGFTVIGPMNPRTERGLAELGEALGHLATMTADDLTPGSMGRDIMEAAGRGDIPWEEGFQLIWNYTGPAFDTTLNAIGNIMWLLATNPGQWELVRSEPDLIPGMIEEGLRVESPIQTWGRFCRDGAAIEGAQIPPGSRVVLLLASGNRDERHYPDPEYFDIRRSSRDHLSFGHGVHNCVGAGLSRLELASLFEALREQVGRIELDGEPVRRLNNTVRGLASLPVRVVAP